MFYHIKANGQIVVTEDRIESEGGIDWQSVSSETIVVVNCPDEETAADCLKQFRKAMVESQIEGL